MNGDGSTPGNSPLRLHFHLDSVDPLGSGGTEENACAATGNFERPHAFSSRIRMDEDDVPTR
jgi:hypothetical protein